MNHHPVLSARYLRSLLCIVVVALSARSLGAQSSPWTLLGPYGGEVGSMEAIGTTVFAVHPYGRLFKSTDGGRYWSRVPHDFRGYIRRLLAHDSLLFVISDSTSYRSADAGITWTQIHCDTSLYDIVYADSLLYGMTHASRIYSSADHGDTWQDIGPVPGLRPFRKLAAHKKTLFFSSNIASHRSLDGGRTWIPFEIESTRRSIAAIASNDSVIVAAVEYPVWPPSELVYRSTDDGATWSLSSTGLSASHIHSIIWADGRFLAAGSDSGGIFSSADGTIWTKMEGGISDDLKSVCAVGEMLFAGSADNGIYRSGDKGVTWEQSTQGYSSIDISRIVEHRGKIFAQGGKRMYVSSDGGAHWALQPVLFPYSTIRDFMVFDDALFVGVDQYMYDSAGIYRSVDGVSWSRVDSGYSGLAMFSSSDDMMAALVRDSVRKYHLRISTDGGVSWHEKGRMPASEFPVGLQPTDLRFAGNLLLLATTEGIFRSFDTGSTWQPGSVWSSGYGVNVLGNSGKTLFAGKHGDEMNEAVLFRSTDNASSWRPVYASPVARFSSNTILARGNTVVASIRYAGIVRSADSGVTWEPFNNGLTDLDVNTVQFIGDDLFTTVNMGGIWRSAMLSGVEDAGAMTESIAASLYPNPSRTSATVRYRVAPDNGARVMIMLFTALGEHVRTIVSEHQPAGDHFASIDVSGLAPGAYFCRVNIAGSYEVRPFVVAGP